MFRRIIAALFFVAVSAAPGSVHQAFAQSDGLAKPITDTLAAATAATQFSGADQNVAQVPRAIAQAPGRNWTSSLVIAMEATTLVTQALDVHSTMKALDAGAVEANPLMSGVVKNKAAFIGVKAAMGAGLMYATHKMAKRNKVAAILTAAAVNSAYLFVAHHNYKLADSLR
jgi:hypothetical protein